jgi:phosphoribosyl 1,2-cyclic phosphate phosphodiesterase
MKNQLLFLGTGASTGVPVIGCHCAVCQSPSPLNKRLRPSALITIDKQLFLIDAGPDFRQQALLNHLTHLDGVLFTHAHHDHTGGIDELRVLYYKSKKALPTLLSRATFDEIKRRYDYIFNVDPLYDKLTTKVQLHILPQLEGSIVFEGVPIQYMSFEQGGMQVNGYRFGNLAYLSDIRVFSPSIFEHLKGVKTLVISALRHETSALHFSLNEAVEFANQVGADNTWLMHISHDLEHDQTNSILPPHIRLAYDGLQIDFE